eukprot:NODE_151_length_17042_cov_0.275925.p6 type:complete len:257 gc:universal NODE_151_length_17042_cov_0.275925:4934-4164(-)
MGASNENVFENLKKVFLSIHPKLGEIDFDEIDCHQDPIQDFKVLLSQIDFTKDVDYRAVISRLNSFNYNMTNKDKENKYLVSTVVHLMMLERQLPIDSMDSKDYIDPSHYDVLLTDVNHIVLVDKVAKELNIKYLQEATDAGKNSINGILFGTNLRPMINLPISFAGNKAINVIFIIDTGSPVLYICETAMKALGFHNVFPDSFDIKFRDGGYKVEKSPKDSHFEQLNLIGSSFLVTARADLAINYYEKTFKMTIQ